MAITLHTKHKDRRDPRQWKGFKFAVPFEYSMHNFLLRYYVAEHGLDPDTDIQDPRHAAAGDGGQPARRATSTAFLGPDPFNQRAVYDEVRPSSTSCRRRSGTGTPAARFGVPEALIREAPNTFAALYRAVLTAARMARGPAQPRADAKVISPPNYSTSRRRWSSRC